MSNFAEIARHIQGLMAASKQHAQALHDHQADIGAMAEEIRRLRETVEELQQGRYAGGEGREEGVESEEESAEA